jgi:hypothetical protein
MVQLFPVLGVLASLVAAQQQPPPASSSFKIEASEMESILGEKQSDSRRYYEAHCRGDGATISQELQQVCYRVVLCGAVGEFMSSELGKSWCANQGGHPFPKDGAFVLSELSAENRAWADAEASLKADAPGGDAKGLVADCGGYNSSEPHSGVTRQTRTCLDVTLVAEGRKQVLDPCRGQGAAGYARPRYCIVEKLDQWRKPLADKAENAYTYWHDLNKPVPDGDTLLKGMSGEKIRKTSDELAAQIVKDAANRPRTALASAESYDAFIGGQGGPQTVIDEKRHERMEVHVNDRLSRIKGGLGEGNSDAGGDGTGQSGQGGGSAGAMGGGESVSQFKPVGQLPSRKVHEPPSPDGALSCLTQEQKQASLRKCEAGSQRDADLDDCLGQIKRHPTCR